MKHPVFLIDWRTSCITALTDMLFQDTGGTGAGLKDTLIVFPHQRPKRYLQEALAQDVRFAKPMFMPQMLSINQWLPGLRAMVTDKPLTEANTLDRIGLLYDIIKDIKEEHKGQKGCFPVGKEEFFPWAMALDSLLEELFRHGKTPQSLTFLLDEVHTVAAVILEHLGEIFLHYEKALFEKGWTTPGLDARIVMEHAAYIAQEHADKRIYIAGFYALTGSEDILLKALWQQGARVLLHTDPKVGEDEKSAHWTCTEHIRLLKSWKASWLVFGKTASGQKPVLRFLEGFDLHSQLRNLAPELKKAPHESTGVVLPNTGMLLPVLHHLPVKDVNISMGYPLARSSLFRLLETLFSLQETAQKEGLYHWKEVIALIRHPYIKMISPRPGLSLRNMLREMERILRQGTPYVDPLTFEPEQTFFEEQGDEETLHAVHEVLEVCLTPFARATTLAELGEALIGVIHILTPEHESDMWQKFPIDAECMYRVSSVVVPLLTGSYLSHVVYDRSVLFSIFRQLMAAERVPFEADPLTGLQVLGMLESRLITFSRVIILDATEENLPGIKSYTPLLPDPLRFLLGLPDSRRRLLVAAHNFYRLLAGAKEACIFYQTGTTGSGESAGKAVRSQFVEQLIWEEEKRLGQVLDPTDKKSPLQRATQPSLVLPQAEGCIEKTDNIQHYLIQRLTTKPVSATFLDSYMHCPVRFFYEHLVCLSETKEVSEDDNPMQFGHFLHEVLHDFFTDYKDQKTDLGTLNPDPLLELYESRLQKEPFYRQMPYDRRLGLTMAGKKRLTLFLKHSPYTTIKKLEENLSYAFTVDECRIQFTGKLDRVDLREQGYIILDYKTGRVDSPDQTIWTDTAFWSGLNTRGAASEHIQEIFKKIKSIQLPLYCWLFFQKTGVLPQNAAWVELQKKGEEKSLLVKGADLMTREFAITKCTPQLVGFVIRHMLFCESFVPVPGLGCQWCAYGFHCPMNRA